jgi:NAD(P)-dependent dehydrogenase (short-subunit alcohol dehydrogenase family)
VLGELDVCVYCAGVGEFLDLETMAAERLVFETNLLGAVATAQSVIPVMVRAGRGHFIGLSSQGDAVIDSGAPSYAASKAGLTSYLEGLALACRRRGVSVTNLRLGFVDTKMAKAQVRPFMLSPAQAAERIRYCIRKRPMRDTFPRRMAVLLWFSGLVSSIRRRFA